MGDINVACSHIGLSTMERGYVEKEDVPSVLENSQSITPEMRGDVVSASTICFRSENRQDKSGKPAILRDSEGSYSAGMRELRNHVKP